MRMCECVTSKLNIEVKSGWSGRGQYVGACVSSKELHRKKEGESIGMLTFGRGGRILARCVHVVRGSGGELSCIGLNISRGEGD